MVSKQPLLALYGDYSLVHIMIRNNDEKLLQLKERNITKVLNRVHHGEDEQADDKYLVLKPSNWLETDPFLLMAEDWFSTNGFD